MAMTLKLVRLTDSAADIDSVDLTSGGYTLAFNGYQPTVAADGTTSVNEVITINVHGSSVDNLATLVQALDNKIRQAGWWIDNPTVERYQVWLRVGLDGETNTRQAMLLRIEPPDKLPMFNRLAENSNLIVGYTFGIERTPFWEDPYAYPTTTARTGVSMLGGKATLAETINGDVPARIAEIAIVPSGVSNELYFGWRSSRLGTIANLTSIWRIVDAAVTNALYTSTSGDGTAYSGSHLTVSLTSMKNDNPGGLVMCAILTASSCTGSPADQRGVFTVLARAKMSDSATTAYLRQGFGYLDVSHSDPLIDSITYRSRKYITGTSWKLYALGNVSIPPEQNTSLDNAGIQLEACLIAGTGELHIDCLVLIPRLEGFASLGYADTSSGSFYSARLKSRADGHLYSYTQYDPASYTLDNAVISDLNWSLPANGDKPMIVLAGQSSAGSTLGDTATITYTYIPRWRTLRGTVT